MPDLDNQANRKRVQNWFRVNYRGFDNSTQLSEACADALNLYEDTVEYKIPEFVFELAAKYYEGK